MTKPGLVRKGGLALALALAIAPPSSIAAVAYAVRHEPPHGAGPACPVTSPTSGPGIIDPFHVPTPAATRLNADGKLLYRLGRWDDARQKYRAAEAADPDFLAPALNVACSFVRQERFGEALDEVLRLIDRAYLPWSQEVLSAADLGALKIRDIEGKRLRAALDAARLRWADGLGTDLIFVARLRPPLRLGDSQGGALDAGRPRALVLGQRQEVFAWSPSTGRYRQLTSEEGRVLAVARSRDGLRMSYVTAQKLVLGADGWAALRGVAVNEVDLGTLVSLGHGMIDGDVRRLDILNVGTGFAYRVGESADTAATLRLVESGLRPCIVPRFDRAAVTLTGRGVVDDRRKVPLDEACGGSARVVQSKNGGLPTIIATGAGRASPSVTVGGPYGAGLGGLPIP